MSLVRNVANDCATAGIALFGSEDFPPAERNTIRRNTTLDNGIVGIGVSGFTEATRARDNLIQGNTSFGNGNRDLFDGIAFAPSSSNCLNTWKDNDFGLAIPADCID